MHHSGKLLLILILQFILPGVMILHVQPSAAMTLAPQMQLQLAKGLIAQPRPGLYILGTVHIGSQSAEEARALIEAVKPSHVVVEVPPSRVERIRRANAKVENQGSSKPPNNNSTDLMGAIRSFPALASAGWSGGGLSGFLFSTGIVWSSLIKRSITVTEEEETLPRRNEFEAAIEAADGVGAEIIAADLEFEELIGAVARSMSPLGWVNLGMTIMSESIGMRPVDPVRRVKDESMVEWEERRRDVNTARASKEHGENGSPELSRVLVDDRDARFAQMCLELIDGDESRLEGGGQGCVIVCIVGLVHLDGVVQILERQKHA